MQLSTWQLIASGTIRPRLPDGLPVHRSTTLGPILKMGAAGRAEVAYCIAPRDRPGQRTRTVTIAISGEPDIPKTEPRRVTRELRINIGSRNRQHAH